MNEPETNSPVPDDLAGQVASLRRQITHLLLVLIVISGTLTTYLFYQSRTFANDLTALEPQAREVIQNYNKNLPNIQKFVQALATYGQAHPDFQPILKKYGIPLTPSAATNSAPKP
jgi:predicted PurR-regulated permease PerM